MSTGIVICSECRREVHQYGPKTWEHCEDRTKPCDGATPVFPASTDEIAGKWCGRDGGDAGVSVVKKVLTVAAGPGSNYLEHKTALLQAIADGTGIPIEELVADAVLEERPAPPTIIEPKPIDHTDKPWREPKQRTNRQPNPKRHARRRMAKSSRRANR